MVKCAKCVACRCSMPLKFELAWHMLIKFWGQIWNAPSPYALKLRWIYIFCWKDLLKLELYENIIIYCSSCNLRWYQYGAYQYASFTHQTVVITMRAGDKMYLFYAISYHYTISTIVAIDLSVLLAVKNFFFIMIQFIKWNTILHRILHISM